MNKISIALIGLLLALAACNKSTKETPNGFKYEVVKAGDGVIPKVGEIVVFDFRMKDSKDSTWQETYKNGMPAAVMIQDTSTLKTESGMVQMFRELSKGDSVIAKLPVKKFFADIVGGPLPPTIDSTLSIVYYIKVSDITDREKYSAKQKELFEKKQAEQLAKDTVLIDKYLADKGITAQKTESGVRYVITTPGNGPTVESGKSVKVNYTGYLLNGAYFDTSVKAVAQEKGLYDAGREPYTPFDVVVDRSNVIRGWHDALKVMNKGSKATFYIPSTLGYGPQRAGKIIEENSVLIFDIELLDITTPENNGPAMNPVQ
jgi:FKBP-type peptidyl-prolyl cis-trans isomerase